ncbi:MAG: bifunctional 5,10-methylenetetrahydrofolate dehydrogenase/5,10-methenyltetrahydrofolate cyclohydrolase [Phycisphaerales bacterium]|nr:bifunctional 5,10-methylenetetrahydrofolate dehydrogenase/5,10-methenyltetrahydrofolate cyclohydrolase [Phycisphaerales bacterium]
MDAAPESTSSPTARPIDGKNLAFQVRRTVARRVAEGKRRVRLDAVLAGEDKGADIYAHNQRKTCAAVGIEYHLHRLPATAAVEEVEAQVRALNEDDEVTAIMVHLPLPEGVEAERIQSLIDETKDVEGVNPANIGNIVYGRRSLVPCTALASVEMIESTGIELRGKRCVIVGASNIVGKPIAVLLMRAEATVISTNKYTEDLASLTRTADVLVSAAGVAGLITRGMVKPGAVVVDVGINRIQGADGKRRTVGDVAFEEVADVAGHLSPVPGGVGPMTVAMLLRNTAEAAGV